MSDHEHEWRLIQPIRTMSGPNQLDDLECPCGETVSVSKAKSLQLRGLQPTSTDIDDQFVDQDLTDSDDIN